MVNMSELVANGADGRQRNPSIEVLRCLLMFLIVFYHGCNNKPESIVGTNVTVKLVPWLLFFCTNSFMFISGWFGIRFGWGRVMRFLGMGAFAFVVLGISSKSVLGHWHWQFTLGWFGNSYLAVMLVAPIVNAGLETLAHDSRRALLLAWGAFACAVVGSWFPIGLHVPGWGGHCFSTMLFIYVSARVVRLAEFATHISVRAAATAFFLALGVHLAHLVLIHFFPAAKGLLISTADYDSPEVLIMGAAFFLMFYRIRFPTWLNTSCLCLAPSMFVVYLLHSGGGPVGSFLYDRVTVLLRESFPFDRVNVLFVVLMSACAVFSGCVLIDALRRTVVRALKRFMNG